VHLPWLTSWAEGSAPGLLQQQDSEVFDIYLLDAAHVFNTGTPQAVLVRKQVEQVDRQCWCWHALYHRECADIERGTAITHMVAGPSLSVLWTLSCPHLDVPDSMHAMRNIKVWARESPREGHSGTCW
jgi:hypothetical protein